MPNVLAMNRGWSPVTSRVISRVLEVDPLQQYLAPFKTGVSVLARFTKRPVVPVHVSGGREVLPHGQFLPRPGPVRVRYRRREPAVPR